MTQHHYLSSLYSHLSRLFLLGLLLSLALGIGTLNAAWNTPPGGTTPPENNTDAPLNVATGVQTKAGGLQMSTLDVVSSMSVGGVPSTGPYLIDMDAATPGTYAGIRFPDGSVQVSAATAFNANNPLSLGSTLTVADNTRLNNMLGFDAAPAYAIDMNALPVTATSGIRFADGSVQTVAASPFNPNAPLSLGSTLTVAGNTRLNNMLGFDAAPTYAIDMNALPVTATSGIRFADGSVQTSAPKVVASAVGGVAPGASVTIPAGLDSVHFSGSISNVPVDVSVNCFGSVCTGNGSVDAPTVGGFLAVLSSGTWDVVMHGYTQTYDGALVAGTERCVGAFCLLRNTNGSLRIRSVTNGGAYISYIVY